MSNTNQLKTGNELMVSTSMMPICIIAMPNINTLKLCKLQLPNIITIHNKMKQCYCRTHLVAKLTSYRTISPVKKCLKIPNR